MTMLLTLTTRSLERQIQYKKYDLTMLDLPQFAMKQLNLRGLNVSASMLSGWTLQQMDKLRDRADKAHCPCLVLVEDNPLLFASRYEKNRQEATDRLQALGVAAHRLGCNAVSIRCEAPDDDESFDKAAVTIKAAMPPVERLELNVLIAPADGLTAAPDRLTELIKRIGGFRIGSLPDFHHAHEAGDATENLKKLAPYAGAIHASVEGFSKGGKHKNYDLTKCVDAIRAVGFVNTLAIDYIGDETDPVEAIETAREQLQAAIEKEDE